VGSQAAAESVLASSLTSPSSSTSRVHGADGIEPDFAPCFLEGAVLRSWKLGSPARGQLNPGGADPTFSFCGYIFKTHKEKAIAEARDRGVGGWRGDPRGSVIDSWTEPLGGSDEAIQSSYGEVGRWRRACGDGALRLCRSRRTSRMSPVETMSPEGWPGSRKVPSEGRFSGCAQRCPVPSRSDGRGDRLHPDVMRPRAVRGSAG